MAASPFAFFRGAALPMADDLSHGPSTNLRVQLCGDAHIENFGVFASPERHLVFDLNDLDETLPGSFEWDVKRLAASVGVVGERVRLEPQAPPPPPPPPPRSAGTERRAPLQRFVG